MPSWRDSVVICRPMPHRTVDRQFLPPLQLGVRIPWRIIVTVVAIENRRAAVINPSSSPAFLTTTTRANNRANTTNAASIVMANVTPTTAEPDACPDIAILTIRFERWIVSSLWCVKRRWLFSFSVSASTGRVSSWVVQQEKQTNGRREEQIGLRFRVHGFTERSGHIVKSAEHVRPVKALSPDHVCMT